MIIRFLVVGFLSFFAFEISPSSAQESASAPEEETQQEGDEQENANQEESTGEESTRDQVQLESLHSEFSALMDELVQARSRIAVIGRTLFRTLVRIRVENRAGEQILTRFSLRLDGSPIFRSDGALGEEERQVFEGFATPGYHFLTVEAFQRARENEDYRYELRDRFRFRVLQGKRIDILIILDDDSDIADDFPDDEEGQFDIRTRVQIEAHDLEQRH